MIFITGLFLLLTVTNSSYSYPSGIKYGKSSSSSVPCHPMSMQIDEVTKELRHPCESQNLHDNTIIEESVATAEDEPCYQELKEIPPAPGLPPFKLSESPIVVQEIELPEYKEIAVSPELPSRAYDIGNEVAPCPTEESIEEVNETPVLPNLPTAPELPPLVSYNEEEDCDNGVAEAIPPPPKPSQTFEQPSRSYDIEDEVAPCPTEESIEEVNETPVLPNLPTAPELPPLVSYNEEEDCDNGVAEAIPPPPKPSQTFEQPSRSYDIEDEVAPCPTEESMEDLNETPVLSNLPTAPELPPSVTFNNEEDCDNGVDESDPSPSKPSPSYVIGKEVAPCPTEDSIEDVNDTPVLRNLPTAPELPPFVPFNEDEECDNGVAEAVPPPPKPSQTFEQPSRSYEIEDEVAPCPTEESIEEVNETPVLPNLPTAPELPPLVSFNEEEDCDNGVAEAIPPPPKPSQTYEQPSRSYDIEDKVAPCPTGESIEDLNETPVLSNLPTAPELPPLVSFNEEEDCDNGVAEAILPAPEPSQTFNEEEECDTPDEDVKNHIIIPPAPEIPIITLPKLPLDIVLPKRKENVVKIPLPNVCAHNIVAERVVPNIICRKTNSSNKRNLVPNPACKHLQ